MVFIGWPCPSYADIVFVAPLLLISEEIETRIFVRIITTLRVHCRLVEQLTRPDIRVGVGMGMPIHYNGEDIAGDDVICTSSTLR